MKELNRKGQVLENLGVIGISIATFTIIIVVAFLVMSETKDASLNLVDASAFVNVTTSITADSFVIINPSCVIERNAVVTLVHNTSNSAVIIAANYTVTSNTINVSVGSTAGATVNITYSCLIKDNAYNSTEELQNATSDIPGWIPLIVIVLIGMLILGMISRFGQ